MDRFIEVTSLRHGEKMIINTKHIIAVMPAHIGCEIIISDDSGRPLPVTEEYQELKNILVART